MEESTLDELTLKDRIKLKRKILKMKKNIQNQQFFLLNNQKIQNLTEKSNKVKEKKEQCMIDFQKRVLTEEEYENRIHQYDLEEYGYELEILLLEKENFLPKSLMNRLNCLYLLFCFSNGIEFLVMKDSEGKKKKLHIQDVYQMLSTFIINDVKTLLGLEQKLAQMYMILNTNPFMTKENAYFLEEEKQKEVYALILEYRDKIKQMDYNKEVVLEKFCICDFFNEDILSVYEKNLEEERKRKL